MPLSLSRPIVFFDLETTGINPVTDRIVEMALVKMLPGGGRETWIKRLNPGMPIPEESTGFHGITDADVADAPTFKQVAKELHAWLKGCDFGGYNAARFDLPMLVEEFLRAGVPVDFASTRMVDVQKIFFKMEQRTLSAAYKFYCGKTMENAHSAEADINATIEVLQAQLERYEDISQDVDGLHSSFSDEEPLVDYARTMIRKGGEIIFNFGKYKGQNVEEVFSKNPSHYDWMMKGDFSLDTKQKISDILNGMKLARLKK